jgi:hypothetical protein
MPLLLRMILLLFQQILAPDLQLSRSPAQIQRIIHAT